MTGVQTCALPIYPITGLSSSGAFSSVNPGGEGTGGNVQLSARNLEVTNRASLTASTLGFGDAGDVILTISETARFDGASILSAVLPDAIGNGGSLEITSNALEVTNGGEIATATLGQGRAGEIVIQDRAQATIKGKSSSRAPRNINSTSKISIC